MVVLNEERNVDMDLLERSQHGELDAFDELITRHKQSVYTLIYRFLGDEELAFEFTQDTFMRAHRVLEDFPENIQVHTWLLSIAGNIARNFIPEDTLDTPHDEHPQQSILQLPEQARMVFVLSVFAGLGYDDIAETVDCPKGTVKSRMNQARILLRDAALQPVAS